MEFDVTVIGGGIAGSFLARQLKLTRPDLRVLVLESATSIAAYKVGESTVEVATSYMVRRLGLSTYLYQHQLPKNGLRFFFDSEAKDLPLTEMTEMGSDHLPFHPSFQLERAALERDLVRLNHNIGVTTELGAKVVDLEMNAETMHTVVWERKGADGTAPERHTVKTRWVCDASGRAHVLGRKLGHKVTKEPRLETSAAWGRYRNVAGLDAVQDAAWQARVNNTSRHLSTNHFMYDGYWIWFIPLAGDLMSVGVVFDKGRIPDGPRTQAQMEAFVNRHRATRDLLAGAVAEDFQAYANVPYHSHDAPYFSSTERWAKIGEAGMFTDPFYSPGSDFIATANELVTAIVMHDLRGDTTAATELCGLANDFYKLKYESSLALYSKQYPTFGSFDVFRLKYRLDFHNYYNLVYWPFLADKLTDPAWLREELRFADLQLRAVNAFGAHFARMGDVLRERGAYHAQNRGGWLNGLDGVAQLQPKIGPVLDEKYRKAELDRLYANVFITVTERILFVTGLSGRNRLVRELPLPVVLALNTIDESSLARMLQRVAGRLTNELRARFPEDGVERVAFEVDAVVPGATKEREVRLTLSGPAGEAHARILGQARAMWDERDGAMASVEARTTTVTPTPSASAAC